jgi:uncharacterized membrane protein
MPILIAISTLFPIILVGCLLPIMGRTRRGVLFGVTVPLDFATSPEARAIVRRYILRSAILALTIILVSILVYAFANSTLLPLLGFVAIPIELFGGLIFWQVARRSIQPHATTVPLVRSAELLPQRPLTAIYASLAALLPIAALALYMHLHWNQIPARWPQNWDASGHVNGWGTRSFTGVYVPILLGAFTVLFMTGVSAFIALASGTQTRQRRRALVPLAALVWLISAVACVMGALPLRHNLSPAMIDGAFAFYLLGTLTVIIVLLRHGGMLNTSPTSEPYDGTPDAKWHGGLIYYNPTDAALIVPKRYGFGWTLNFARPAAWLYMGCIIALLIGVKLLSHWLK